MRTTKVLFKITFLVFISLSAFGQSDGTAIADPLQPSADFLRNYIPPNFRYTTLLLRPGFAESSNSSETLSKSQLDLDVDLYLNFIQQKDKSNTTLRIDLGESYNRSVINEIKNSNDNYFRHTLNINVQHDYYLNEKIFVGGGATYGGRNDRALVDDWVINQVNSGTFQLGLGFGRIFSVGRAWMAQSLLNDLECNGIAVDRSAVKDLSDLLVMQQYRRVFDNRLNRIKRRAEAYTFMHDNQVAEFTPFSAALLEDSFRFENFRNRLSGYRLYAGLRPDMNRTKSRSIDSEEISTSFSLFPFVEFDYHLPLSEDWQIDFLSFFSARDISDDEGASFSRANAQFSLAWLPNLRVRSSLNLIYSGSFSNSFVYNGVSLGYNLFYYFSPRMVGNIQAIVGNNWAGEVNQVQSDFSQRISIGFNYYLL